MAVISGQDYYDVSEAYSAAIDALNEVSGHLWDATYIIVLLQQVQPEVDLLTAFYDSYKINSAISTSTLNYLGAVRALQNHIIVRGGYDTVNTYIRAEIKTALGLLIPDEFASLSAAAGYPIDSDLVA